MSGPWSCIAGQDMYGWPVAMEPLCHNGSIVYASSRSILCRAAHCSRTNSGVREAVHVDDVFFQPAL